MSGDTHRFGPTPGRGPAGPLGRAAVLALVVAALVAAVTLSPAAAGGSVPATAGTPPDLAVGDVSVSGAAVAARHDGTVLLWRSRPYSLTATVGDLPAPAEYRVCALTATAELNCTTATLRPAGTAVELRVPGSVAKSTSGSASDAAASAGDSTDESAVVSLAPGVRNVSVSVTRVGGNETVVVSRLARLRVLVPTADFDGDGLSNRDEREQGTDPAAADTDRDLFDDGTETALGTDPLKRKTAVGFGVTGLFALGVAVGLLYRFGPRLVASLLTRVGAKSESAALASRSDATGRGRTERSEPHAAGQTDGARRTAGTERDATGREASGRGTGAAGRETTPPESTGRRDAGRTDDRGERDPDPSPPLSDEERVLGLLEANDGQLPQSEIVSRTPWSKSKVSRLLARMDAQELVVKINAGRRNVIVLPGEEPEAVQSLGDGDDG
ncbi:MarR family transcriptional regulator (plasmid) [Halorussus limi]|uniref:MarR family transcriptional regulator n=1 Tax=Halorussus limi TaxID=2938695 RepID=A0A8U0I1V0_9EURY|nr:MarR family transcriptional regulator [Halorussus limi]UPV76861.1 MarR family transcriptional regulator [Halorussus limi]